MSRKRTVLLMSRDGGRTYPLFRGLAANLSKDHRVVVLAPSAGKSGFASIGGVEVRSHSVLNLEFSPSKQWMGDDDEVREKAKVIEQKIGLPLYKAASNCLLYGRIVKGYGGYWNYPNTEKALLQAYVESYEYLEKVFEEIRPDVVFYETIDLIYTHIAYALALRYGAFGLEFRFAPLGEGRIYPGSGLSRRNILLEYLFSHREKIRSENYNLADGFLKNVSENLLKSAYSELHRNMIKNNTSFRPSRLLSALLDLPSLSRGIRNIKWHTRKVKNRIWIERNFSKDIGRRPYVMVFLHHLPEASGCSEAPRWIYQDMLVEQLAVNAPSHLRILVKEHPRSYGNKGRKFFKPLQDLPNVTLCHPSMNNQKLVSGAEAIIVTNGTLGLEGILLGKRVGVLGRPSYSIYPGVKKLNHPEEIYSALQDPSWKPEEMQDERRDFLAAYFQSSYVYGHGKGTDIQPPRGGDLLAQALRKTMEAIEQYQLKPGHFDAE